MGSVEENKFWWDTEKDWTEAGNEWSGHYGTPAMQWFTSLLPRIHCYVPAPTILEIAPGFGRWTHFLKGMCDHLIVIDLSVKCIEACKERFKDETHIEYHVTDGKSLAMVPQNSIDFLFTFDSLVHAEKDVMRAYLEQLPGILKPNGVAFIHHSNLGSHLKHYEFVEKLPRGRGFLHRRGLVEITDHLRARSMTSDLFRSFASLAGLSVISQEEITWGTRRAIDCISVVTRPGSIWDAELNRLVNTEFEREPEHSKKLAALYDRPRRGR